MGQTRGMLEAKLADSEKREDELWGVLAERDVTIFDLDRRIAMYKGDLDRALTRLREAVATSDGYMRGRDSNSLTIVAFQEQLNDANTRIFKLDAELLNYRASFLQMSKEIVKDPSLADFMKRKVEYKREINELNERLRNTVKLYNSAIDDRDERDKTINELRIAISTISLSMVGREND